MTTHKRKQRGVAAIEMALVITPAMLLCFGITELGRALYQYDGLVKAARGGVRYLAQQSLASPPIGEDATSLRLKARSLVVCGELDCTGKSPLVPGLTLAMVSVCDPVGCPATHANVPTGEGTVSVVTVTVGDAAPFRFTSVVPWAVQSLNLGPVSISMASSAN